MSEFLKILCKSRGLIVPMVGRSQVPSSSSFHSAGCLAARSGMVGGSFSRHPSGGSASGSGIVSGRDSSQSAGFVASGSGMLRWVERKKNIRRGCERISSWYYVGMSSQSAGLISPGICRCYEG